MALIFSESILLFNKSGGNNQNARTFFGNNIEYAHCSKQIATAKMSLLHMFFGMKKTERKSVYVSKRQQTEKVQPQFDIRRR